MVWILLPTCMRAEGPKNLKQSNLHQGLGPKLSQSWQGQHIPL